MASVFINDLTSVVLVESSKSSNMPFTVYFPDVSTNGRLITVKDTDGFVSSGREIFLSTVSTSEFFETDNPIVINQPFGFVTLATSGDGYYELVNSYALPQGPTNYVSNIYTEVTTVVSNVEFIDIVTNNSNILYLSSGQLVFNNTVLGNVTYEDLESTVANLGSLGYISTLPLDISEYPAVSVVTGLTSNQRVATNNVSTPIGSIQYSYDGSNYINANGGFFQYGTAVTYSEQGLFVAAGANCSSVNLLDQNTGFLQYSSNGINWFNSTGPVLGNSTLRTAVSYGNNLYHAVGYSPFGGSQTILYSQNGISWLPASVQFVAVGNNSGGNTIFSSTDGNTWIGRGNPFGSGGGAAVAWNGSLWVAVGGGSGNTIATSPDGISWTSRGDPFGAPNTFQGGTAVQWNGSYWLATGYGNTNSVVASSNGISWSGRGRPLIAGRGLGWNGSYWVLTGSNNGSQIFTSSDGSNWTGRGFYFFGINSAALGVGWNGSYWAVGGDWEGGSKIVTSPDGINWTGRNVNFVSRTNSVTWNGSYWVATGGGDVNTVATSSDGVTWTIANNNVFFNSGTGAVWTGNRWIATGYFTNGLATSTDGVNWSVIPTTLNSLLGIGQSRIGQTGFILFESSNSTSGYATGVAYGNGVWVCSGSQNVATPNYSLLYSTDGSNWNPSITVPFTGKAVNDVSFDGIKFMALCQGATGSSSNLVYSYDGKNWSNNNIIGAGFGNRGKYITGNSGVWVAYVSTTTNYIFYSSNEGSNWFQSSGLPANGIASKPYFDGSRWVIGIYTALQGQSVYQTTDLLSWNNSGINSGFTNGGSANAFSKSLGFSNATGYFNSYQNALYQTGITSNITANSITASSISTSILITSSLFTNVTVATINNQFNESISTVRVNNYVASTFSNTINITSSMISKSIENVVNLDVDSLFSINNSYEFINSRRVTLGTLELNQSRVILGAGTRNQIYDNYVAIGSNAGLSNQDNGAIAIGFAAGSNTQQADAIAIGYLSGTTGQNANGLTIGALAGQNTSLARTIVLNASGTALEGTTFDSCYIRPIRSVANPESGPSGLAYDLNTNEVLSEYTITTSSFNTVNTSSFSVGFPNPGEALSVIGLTRIARDSNTIQFGGSQASNGPTFTYNTIKGNSSAEFISAKDSASAGGGFDFYTNLPTNRIPANSNLVFTINQSTIGVNMSTPKFSLDVVGLLRATSSISTFAYLTNRINGIPYPQEDFTLSNLNVRNQLFTPSSVSIFLSVNSLVVTGNTVFGIGCNAEQPNNPDLQMSNLNFYTSLQGKVDTNKNYIQTVSSVIVFNSTLSVNYSTNRVGINMSTPLHSLDVRGNIFTTSTIFAPYAVLGNGTVVTSDSNIKENIESANLLTCYENTKQLPLRYFSYKSPYDKIQNDHSVLGFIAQEVEPIFPKSVQKIKDFNTHEEILHLSKDQILMSHYGATQYLVNQIEKNSTIMGDLFSKIIQLNNQISSFVGGNV